MNGCLTTPQHEKQIGYWVSDIYIYSIFRPFLRMYLSCLHLQFSVLLCS